MLYKYDEDYDSLYPTGYVPPVKQEMTEEVKHTYAVYDFLQKNNNTGYTKNQIMAEFNNNLNANWDLLLEKYNDITLIDGLYCYGKMRWQK